MQNQPTNTAETVAKPVVPTQNVQTPYDNTETNFSNAAEAEEPTATPAIENVSADNTGVVKPERPVPTVASAANQQPAPATDQQPAPATPSAITPPAATTTTPPLAAINNGLDARAKQFDGKKALENQQNAAREAEAMATVMNDPQLLAWYNEGGQAAEDAIKTAMVMNAKGGINERMGILKPQIETPDQTADRQKREARDRKLAGLAQMLGALGTLGVAASSRDGRAVKLADLSGAVGKQQTAAQAEREKIFKKYSDYEKQRSELINKEREASAKRIKAERDEQYRKDRLELEEKRAQETEKYHAENTRLKEEKQKAEQERDQAKQELAKLKEQNRHSESVNNEAGRNARAAESENRKDARAEKSEQGKDRRTEAKAGRNSSGKQEKKDDAGKRSTKRENRSEKKDRDF